MTRRTVRLPSGGELSGVEQMKIEAATVSHHHNVGHASDMRPVFVVVFHCRLSRYEINKANLNADEMVVWYSDHL